MATIITNYLAILLCSLLFNATAILAEPLYQKNENLKNGKPIGLGGSVTVDDLHISRK